MNNTPAYNPNNNEILTTETAKILDTKPLDSTPEAGKPTPRLRLTAAILSTAALLLLCGSLLARAGVPLVLAESQTGDDRLAGIFVTEKYIEPGIPEIDVNALGEIVIKEQEPVKIYGTFNEDDLSKPVTFPGLEGYGIYNLQLQSGTSQEPSGYYTGDDIFTDMHVTVSDGEEHLEASFYVRAGIPWSCYSKRHK